MFKQCYDFNVECTSITRCIRVHCSTYTDQTCLLCNSGYHPSGQICAREFYNLYNAFSFPKHAILAKYCTYYLL